MIVRIALGETGVNVVLDDDIDSYDPLRTVELCREARRLFAGAYMDTLTTEDATTEDADAEGEASL